MKIGLCGKIERVKAAALSGFDYLETSFYTFYDDDEYKALKNELKKYGLPCKAANNFLGSFKIAENDVDYVFLEKYLKKCYERAADLGVKTVVLGSGKGRSVPENHPFREGVKDMIKFISDYAAPEALKYNIDFLIEPLAKNESNVINTLTEGALLASSIDAYDIGLVADIYHMYRAGDEYDDIKKLKGMVRHAHISNPVPTDKTKKRIFVKDPSEYDYKGFFDALKYVGCEKISIEAQTDDCESDAKLAAKVLNLYR